MVLTEKTEKTQNTKNRVRDTRRTRGRFFGRLLFLLRILGMAGLLAASASVVLLNPVDLQAAFITAWESIDQLIQRKPIPLVAQVLVAGLGVAAVALVVEILRGVWGALWGRTGGGLPRLIEFGAAVAILASVNWLAFHFSWHYDGTRGKQFTLPETLVEPLQHLRGQTRVVVLQRHRTLAGLSDRPDRWDLAAEKKIVEKIRDLASLLREVGTGSLKVETLDVEDEDFERNLQTLTLGSPRLKQAIDAAPENTIFFHGLGEKGPDGQRPEYLQQLSFVDFLRLDKTASQEANGGKGNLVLLPQGVPGATTDKGGPAGAAPFVRRLLNLQERPPRIAIGVIDEWLSTKGVDIYGLNGLRKSLTQRGFEVRDVILKKLRSAPPGPVVYTFDESRLDRLETRQQRLQIAQRNRESMEKQVSEIRKLWKEKPLADLEKAYAAQLRGRKLSEQFRALQLEELDGTLEGLKELAKRDQKLAEEVAKEKATLDEDNLVEQRRMTDLQGKLSYLLADCDLLIIPRPTLTDVVTDERNLPPWLYSLDSEQVSAVKEFLKRGRPVLFAAGPTSTAADDNPATRPPGFVSPDGVDALLGEIGFKLNKQTVLFDVESEAFSEQMGGVLTGGTGVVVPPLLSSWKFGAGRPTGMTPSYQPATGELEPHPIRQSLELAARSMGRDKSLDLRLRHPRPIYFDPPAGMAPLKYDPDLLMTSQESWNDEQPFPTAERIPSYEAPKDGKEDPNKGTVDARRRGPFPVGAAVDVTLPATWFAPGEKPPESTRVAVLGESWFLVGPELGPFKERLALDTINWLLGRDDFLARASDPWSFPRIEMEPKRRDLWRWAVQLGFPVLCAFAGVVVLLTRRLR